MMRPVRWRIGVLFITGLLALLTVPLALYYALRGADELTGLPQPRQLAAIVEAAEQTAPIDRATVFRALQSAQLSARVAAEAPVQTDLEPLWLKGTDVTPFYQDYLGDRDFAAYAVPRRLFPNGPVNPLRAAEFRVALTTGETLLVASESLALFTPRGVPIGFPTAFVGVLIAFTTLLLLNREFRSVLRLAKAVEAVDPSDPSAQLPAIRARTTEVRTLIEVFTKQQAQVSTLLTTRAALIGGIQHDVRTFATRLRLRIEKLADHSDRAQAETDIADLIALMDGALVATRAEANALDLELIDFAALLEAEHHDQTATGAPVDLVITPDARNVQLLADRVALRRILVNLIENALRYGNSAYLRLAPTHSAQITRMIAAQNQWGRNKAASIWPVSDRMRCPPITASSVKR